MSYSGYAGALKGVKSRISRDCILEKKTETPDSHSQTLNF